MLLTDLEKGAQGLGISLDSRMLERFSRLRELLLEWNDRINLTALTDPADILHKHFLDSLTLVEAIHYIVATDTAFQGQSISIIDVGSGAGFPGLPLAITKPDWNICLLEATAKKVAFLDTVIAELKLDNVRTKVGRAEEVGHDPDYREQFSFAVARAVAPLATLGEYCLPFVKVGGYFIAQKGLEPVEPSLSALIELGGAYKETKSIKENRNLVVVHKASATPEKYPRRVGVPSKKPLL